MKNKLRIGTKEIEITWDESSSIIDQVKSGSTLEGKANNIQGEVFFYQFRLDIPFDGTEKEVFDVGDIVYWRSAKEKNKFGILFMYGNTSYGDGTKPRTSSPGIKIGTFLAIDQIRKVETNINLKFG